VTCVELQRGASRASIALRGAEPLLWEVEGLPLLWQPDPAIWAETAPILFPVVGWTRNSRVTVDGTAYPLGLHGFARDLTFEVLEHSSAHVRLALASSPATQRLYPFAWRLEVEHLLEERALTTRLTVRNTGATAMPYACGLHPGFCWPFAGGVLEDYEILFAEREQARVPVISAEGLFTRESRHVPLDGRRLALSPLLLEREALCFLEARSRTVRFAHRSGAAIEVALDDFPHIALWSRPAGRFLSIEAWTGHGDFVDADGDLLSKASMRHLPPGATGRHGAKFSFDSAHVFVVGERLGSPPET